MGDLSYMKNSCFQATCRCIVFGQCYLQTCGSQLHKCSIIAHLAESISRAVILIYNFIIVHIGHANQLSLARIARTPTDACKRTQAALVRRKGQSITRRLVPRRKFFKPFRSGAKILGCSRQKRSFVAKRRPLFVRDCLGSSGRKWNFRFFFPRGDHSPLVNQSLR